MDLKLKMLFIFPPFAESALNGPHLASPLLISVLRSAGYNADYLDINIRCMRKLLSAKFMNEMPIQLNDSSMSKRFVECLKTIKKRSPLSFSNAGTPGLRVVLSMIRKFYFSTPTSLINCLEKNIDERPNKYWLEIYNELIDEIIEKKHEILCFSIAFSEQLSEVIILTRLLKKRKNFNSKIVIGGSQINLLSEVQINQLKNSNLFTAISIGNGEHTILEIAQLLEQKSNINTNCIIVKSQKFNKEDLFKIPTPIFNDLKYYFKPISFPVLVTKGCYWGKCSFCDYPRLSQLGSSKYIAQQTNKIYNEIVNLKKRYPKCHINLISDAVPPNIYMDIFKLAIKDGTDISTWSYMLHSSNLNDNFFSQAKKAGVRAINFGTESTNDRILKKMNKLANRSTIFKNIRSASKNNIRVVINFIPDYPGISFSEATKMSNDIISLLPNIYSFNPHVFDLTDGTPLANSITSNCNDNSIPYLRTKHGYHSINNIFQHNMTDTQRNIIRRIFLSIKRKALIDRRREKVIKKNNCSYILDGSTVIYKKNEKTILWIASIDTEYPITKQDEIILSKILNDSQIIKKNELKEIYQSVYDNQTDFNEWIENILNTGLFLDCIINENFNGVI